MSRGCGGGQQGSSPTGTCRYTLRACVSATHQCGCVKAMATPAEGDPKAVTLRSLGQRVQDLRLARGLTQDQLAAATGIHRVSMNKLEHGKTDIGISNVTALARALGVTPAELFRERGT